MLMRLGLAIGLVALAIGVAPSARAQGGVRIGTLTCNVASGWGFVFGSSKGLRCTLSPGPGRPEYYAGTINKFGVDIGYTQGGVLVWAVFAPTANPGPGALNGNYVGATGSATVGVGVGANVLVGGSNSTISLQPLSIEGNTGLNVAAGIGSITLRYPAADGPAPSLRHAAGRRETSLLPSGLTPSSSVCHIFGALTLRRPGTRG
jgi:uncharacterized protein DUF992